MHFVHILLQYPAVNPIFWDNCGQGPVGNPVPFKAMLLQNGRTGFNDAMSSNALQCCPTVPMFDGTGLNVQV